jgi:homogentisate 1,2-dioxygenase
MTPHGPDTKTFEAAVRDEQQQPHHLGNETMAFM